MLLAWRSPLADIFGRIFDGEPASIPDQVRDGLRRKLLYQEIECRYIRSGDQIKPTISRSPGHRPRMSDCGQWTASTRSNRPQHSSTVAAAKPAEWVARSPKPKHI